MNNIVDRYFRAFCKKDLETLSSLYKDDIVLNEWNENTFVGKEAVLQANKDLFNKFNNIDIIIDSCGDDNLKGSSLNEITVLLDGVKVQVIDVITIKDNKIVKINAYRGF
jgi:ketosteroid isomerase-like protein